MAPKSGCPVLGQRLVNSGQTISMVYSRPGLGLGKVSICSAEGMSAKLTMIPHAAGSKALYEHFTSPQRERGENQQGGSPCLSPLSPRGRGVGGEGAAWRFALSPSPPTPLPHKAGGEGRKKAGTNPSAD